MFSSNDDTRVSEFAPYLFHFFNLFVDPTTGYHCHFTGNSCKNGEKYLSPVKAEVEGLPKCTCNKNYNNNMYVNTCYSMTTQQVTCLSFNETCPDIDIGTCSGSGLVLSEFCGHGSMAFGAFNPPSCGNRCTCNYAYQSRTEQVMADTTMYGMCYNFQTCQGQCYTMKDYCDSSSEMYVNSTHAMVPSGRCTCTEVEVGAFISKKGKFKSYDMAADSCVTGHTFISPLELVNSDHDYSCR